MKSIIPSRIAEMLYALAMGTFGVLHLKDADKMSGYKIVPDYMPGDA